MAHIYYDEKTAPKKKLPTHTEVARARAQRLQKWVWILGGIAACGWLLAGGLLWRILV